jgi:ribokinase
VLNAAPVAELDSDLLGCVDVLVVNEGEARALAGPSGSAAGPDKVVEHLLQSVASVVVTLGAAGSWWRTAAGDRHDEEARSVPVVDTTAAGDTFCGYLAAALAEGSAMPAAMRLATAAAALCV